MKGVYQIASSLVLLAMTEGGHCGRSPRVIVSPSSPVIASPSPPVILTLSPSLLVILSVAKNLVQLRVNSVKGKNLKMLRTGSGWRSQGKSKLKNQNAK